MRKLASSIATIFMKGAPVLCIVQFDGIAKAKDQSLTGSVSAARKKKPALGGHKQTKVPKRSAAVRAYTDQAAVLPVCRFC